MQRYSALACWGRAVYEQKANKRGFEKIFDNQMVKKVLHVANNVCE